MPRIFGEIPTPATRKKTAPASPGKVRKPILLYVHFPFCRSKCHYCAFHSQAYNQVTFSWYLKTLLAEIELWSARLEHPTLHTIYFGGGTPSLMQPMFMDRIMKTLAKNFSFQKGIEITMEANPDSACDVSYYRAMLSMGVNRLSLGVQSLDDQDLIRLGRPHSSAQAVEAFSVARSAGFANINLDLIWGLPMQRLKVWLSQLEEVNRLKPDHLSCYGLTLEPGTPLGEKANNMDLQIAPEKELSKMFLYGAEYLESQGYLQYEISNFARMGFHSRHNLGYWEGADYLGLGPSAVSTIGNRRFSNPSFMDEYDAAVRGEFAGDDYEELDEMTRNRERIMLALRTSKGIALKDLRKMIGFDITRTHEKLVQAMYQNRLIRINRGRLSLTKEGMVVSNVILERIALAEDPQVSLQGNNQSLEN